MIKVPQQITLWLGKNKKTFTLWVFFTLISLVLIALQSPRSLAPPRKDNIDSYIPPGLVLLPLELSNKDSLSGLLQTKGVVDLYSSDPQFQQTKKVAHAVKIIRSPLNPEHFAVLVPENQAVFLIKRFKSFYAVIQNPNKKGGFIPPPRKKRKRSITIELDTQNAF